MRSLRALCIAAFALAANVANASPFIGSLAAGAVQQVVQEAVAMPLARRQLEIPTATRIGADIEAKCLALGIYHEARGESVAGQAAVAQVILNRVRSKVYPSSICGVIYQNAYRLNRCQFSFTCDRVSDMPRNARAWKKAYALSKAMLCADCDMAEREILESIAPFHRATHYHAIYVRPVWARKLRHVGRIGTHIFFESDRVLKRM